MRNISILNIYQNRYKHKPKLKVLENSAQCHDYILIEKITLAGLY